MTLPTKKNLAIISVATIQSEISPWPLFRQDKQGQHLQSLQLGQAFLALSILVTLYCTSFRFSTLLLNWGSQNWAQDNQPHLFKYVSLYYGVAPPLLTALFLAKLRWYTQMSGIMLCLCKSVQEKV